MVMPTLPGANLVLRETGFALGAFDALFDAVHRANDAGELRQRRFCWGIRQMVIVLQRTIRVARSHDLSGPRGRRE